jgi:hypothetical protein
MYVVLRPTDGHGNHFVVLTNPRQVSPQSRLPFFRNAIAAILGAKNQMDMVPGEGMCQSVAPTGLYTIAILAPTALALNQVQVPRWATVFRP